MKIKHLIEIQTETYEEQQFILDKFPDSFWNVRSVNDTRFYVPKNKGKIVQEALNEYEERIKK